MNGSGVASVRLNPELSAGARDVRLAVPSLSVLIIGLLLINLLGLLLSSPPAAG